MQQNSLILKVCFISVSENAQRMFIYPSEMFEYVHRHFRDYPELIQRLFKDFQRFFIDCSLCSEMFQRFPKDSQMFSRISEIVQRYVRVPSNILQRCSNVSRGISSDFQRHTCFIYPSGMENKVLSFLG